MATLPQFQSDDRNFQMLQNRWAAQINPMLANQSLQSSILTNVALVAGDNTINHRLGKNLTGWRIIRIRAAATIYDRQDANQHPDLTLVLTSSAPVICDLEVF